MRPFQAYLTPVAEAFPEISPLEVYFSATFTAASDTALTAYVPETGSSLIKTASGSWAETLNVIASTDRVTALSTGTAYYLLSADLPSVGSINDVDLYLNATESSSANGLQLRGSPLSADRSGYFVAIVNQQISLYRPNTSGSASLLTAGPQAHVATVLGTVVRLKTLDYNDEDGNPVIMAWANGEPVIWSATGTALYTDSSAGKITRAGRPGLRIVSQVVQPLRWRCTAIDPTQPIEFASPANEQVIQRNVDLTTGVLTIDAQAHYAATGYTARVIDDVTKAEVVASTYVPTTDGRLQQAITIPRTGLFMLELTQDDDPTRIYRRRFAVGAKIPFLGQSNQDRMLHAVGSGAGLPTMSRIIDNGALELGWRTIANVAGARMYAQKAEEALGCPIGICMFAISGTTIESWQSDGSSWAAFISPVNGIYQPGCSPEFEAVDWLQGENNTGDVGSVYATFTTKTLNVFDQLDAINTWPGQAKYFVGEIGHQISAVAPATNDIRRSQRDLPSLDARCHTGAAFWGIAMADPVHAASSDAGYGRAAMTRVQAVAYAYGLAAYGALGPTVGVPTATAGGNTILVPMIQDHGTGWGDSNGGATGAGMQSCFSALANDVTPLTINSTLFVGNSVQLTLAANLATTNVKVAYLEGPQPGYNPVIVDNTTPQGGSIGLPLRPTAGGFIPVTVS